MALQYVRGLEGLLETLKALPPEIVSKSGGPVRAALRKAGVIFQRAAQANVKAIVAEPNKDGTTGESAGTLEDALIVSRRKPRPGFKGEIFALRVKRGSIAPNGQPARVYGGVLEFGYEDMAAKSWMRKAFEEKKDQALAAFVSEMRKRIDAAAKKAVKQGLRR